MLWLFSNDTCKLDMLTEPRFMLWFITTGANEVCIFIKISVSLWSTRIIRWKIRFNTLAKKQFIASNFVRSFHRKHSLRGEKERNFWKKLNDFLRNEEKSFQTKLIFSYSSWNEKSLEWLIESLKKGFSSFSSFFFCNFQGQKVLWGNDPSTFIISKIV